MRFSIHKTGDYTSKGKKTLIDVACQKNKKELFLVGYIVSVRFLFFGRQNIKKYCFLPASRALLSTAPDLPIFSLPAKSTRLSLPIFNLCFRGKSLNLLHGVIFEITND